jgi:hypothetical protein
MSAEVHIYRLGRWPAIKVGLAIVRDALLHGEMDITFEVDPVNKK